MLPADGLDHKIVKLDDGRKLVMVKLPEPEAIGEAHLVGCVIGDKPPTIIYTLERSFRFAIFCAWEDRAHLNYGFGMEVSYDNFQKAILEKEAEE